MKVAIYDGHVYFIFKLSMFIVDDEIIIVDDYTHY